MSEDCIAKRPRKRSAPYRFTPSNTPHPPSLRSDTFSHKGRPHQAVPPTKRRFAKTLRREMTEAEEGFSACRLMVAKEPQRPASSEGSLRIAKR